MCRKPVFFLALTIVGIGSAQAADIGNRRSGHPGLSETRVLEKSQHPTIKLAKAAKQPAFRPVFRKRNAFLTTLRQLHGLPLLHFVQNDKKNLYFGISEEGTIGIHFSIRQPR